MVQGRNEGRKEGWRVLGVEEGRHTSEREKERGRESLTNVRAFGEGHNVPDTPCSQYLGRQGLPPSLLSVNHWLVHKQATPPHHLSLSAIGGGWQRLHLVGCSWTDTGGACMYRTSVQIIPPHSPFPPASPTLSTSSPTSVSVHPPLPYFHLRAPTSTQPDPRFQPFPRLLTWVNVSSFVPSALVRVRFCVAITRT